MVSTAAMAWGNRLQVLKPKTQADIACTHSACGGDERFLVERAEENALGPGAPIGLHQRVRDVILSAKTDITGLAGGSMAANPSMSISTARMFAIPARYGDSAPAGTGCAAGSTEPCASGHRGGDLGGGFAGQGTEFGEA
ncbi:hypothetical protein [Saccharopolyspora sp. NPDC002376]